MDLQKNVLFHRKIFAQLKILRIINWEKKSLKFVQGFHKFKDHQVSLDLKFMRKMKLKSQGSIIKERNKRKHLLSNLKRNSISSMMKSKANKGILLKKVPWIQTL